MTVGRLDACFAALAGENRAAFVAYLVAGDPDAKTSLAMVKSLPGAGVDIVELGFAFSDPIAEGPTIQRASQRALAAGMTLAGVLELARRFRQSDQTTPVVLMGYLNPLLTHGLEAFAADAAAAGVDGLIVVDCPPEEAGPLADALQSRDLALICLATPTTDDPRLALVTRRASGFVYYVSVAGTTGAKEADAAMVRPAVARVRAASRLPVCVGFGIRTPERAAQIAAIADGVVVGSALVEAIETAIAQNRDPVSKVVETADALAKAVHAARLGGAGS
ncbi:MAG TPA: tryptophan synthase subunit alpha [Caulobacteraceae bacterium]